MKRTKHIGLLLVIFAGIFSCGWLPAQTERARLTIGRREPLPAFFEYVASDGGIVTLGNLDVRSSRHQAVTKYDGAFVKQWKKTILEQNGSRKIDFLSVLGDNIFVFVSEFFPREKAIRTWYTQYDLEGNEVEKEKVVAELPNEKEHRTDLLYELSLNKKKLLAYRELNNDDQNEGIEYYLFDQVNGLEANGNFQLPYPDNKIQVRKLVVSNQGNVFVLAKYFVDGKVQDPDDYSFIVFRHDREQNSLTQVSIPAAAVFISDLNMKVDKKENIFLAGFYSELRSDAIVGTVFLRVSPSLEIETQSNQKFTEAFLAKFLSERQIERGRELRNFYLDNIILRSDGGVLLIAEKFYTTFNSYLDVYGYWVDTKVYHYDDIIVSSVSAAGDLEWSSVIPKSQTSEVRDYLSYLDVVSGANLFVLYSYQPRREAETIYYNTVDETGKVSERGMLLASSDFELLVPRESAQISNSEALLVYYHPKQKTYTLLKMEFE